METLLSRLDFSSIFPFFSPNNAFSPVFVLLSQFEGSGVKLGQFGLLVDLVLEDVEIVCSRHSDDVLLRVPRGVKDLFAEV